MSRWLKLSLLALGCSALLSACGDDGESSSESSNTTSTSSTSGSGSGGGGGDATGGGGSGASDEGEGGSGGGETMRAEAQIEGLNDSPVTGTATFTQTGEEVTLTITLEDCPAGEHAAHIHENKSCDDEGMAAGDHWIPNGEQLGNFTCAEDGTGTQTVARGTDVWTVGDGSDTDVTKFSIVVHAAGDPTAGGRIGCGVIDVVE